ncbi:MAG: acetyl-CoA carboxylase carboxyl transferase subunit alpha, partial [Methylococcales bacterium]|nr:acetyl-CoA carboxylase carboxyl transferase subunit alpha [Methylococcales bacterium]
PEAAEIMGITADRLKSFNLIDGIITEPIGGAHRDYPATMHAVKNVLKESLCNLQEYSIETLLEKRLERLMTYGSFKEVKVD